MYNSIDQFQWLSMNWTNMLIQGQRGKPLRGAGGAFIWEWILLFKRGPESPLVDRG